MNVSKPSRKQRPKPRPFVGMELRRGGPMFRWLGEELAIDLANTMLFVEAEETWDLLGSPEQIDLWLQRERERLGSTAALRRRPEALIQLRDAIHEAFTAQARRAPLPGGAVSRLNRAAAAACTYSQLDSHGRHVQRTRARASAERALARIAESAIGLLGGPQRDRLQICPAPNCGMFFLAGPRERWCCSACGNRARVARHYRRHRPRTARVRFGQRGQSPA